MSVARRVPLWARVAAQQTPAPPLEDIVDKPIVVGFDGSSESVAAADWAARESLRRGLPLELLQAWPWQHGQPLGSDDAKRWGKEQLARKEVELRALLSGIEVTVAHIPGAVPADVLEAAGKNATMLVLGSRGLGALRGFLVGSVSQEVLTRATCPVVLVRAGTTTADEHPASPRAEPAADVGYREVALGLDTRHPCEEALAFAFEAASVRSAPLRVVHAWGPPSGTEYLAFGSIGGLERDLMVVEQDAVTRLLKPWRERYPEAEVVTKVVMGNAANTLLEETPQAGLLVIGRRTRRAPIGPRLGPVAHAVIHHARCPVAIVPCG
ncbi:universal stress protein [Kitasatospora sp. NPDC056138]|uniref:universal stress protein n=1 Tax=Kitasatospora sp. NPDC056138 TaxID=3345724 RepID=UPI0035D8094E